MRQLSIKILIFFCWSCSNESAAKNSSESGKDTTGAVTGGLAGLLYGFDKIPPNWLKQLARYNDIEQLAERLSNKQNK